MKCGGCGAELGGLSARGEPMLRGRGLILKAEGIAVVCPKCKADVPVSRELGQALVDRLQPKIILRRKS